MEASLLTFMVRKPISLKAKPLPTSIHPQLAHKNGSTRSKAPLANPGEGEQQGQWPQHAFSLGSQYSLLHSEHHVPNQLSLFSVTNVK